MSIRILASEPGKFKDGLPINAPQFSATLADETAALTDWTKVTQGDPIEVGATAEGNVLLTVISGAQEIEVAVVPVGNAADSVDPIPLPANYAYTGILADFSADVFIRGV